MKTKKIEFMGLCETCGKELYPKADNRKMCGITVCLGTCPRCTMENVTIIPVRDFEYASGKKGVMWD